MVHFAKEETWSPQRAWSPRRSRIIVEPKVISRVPLSDPRFKGVRAMQRASALQVKAGIVLGYTKEQLRTAFSKWSGLSGYRVNAWGTKVYLPASLPKLEARIAQANKAWLNRITASNLRRIREFKKKGPAKETLQKRALGRRR